MAMERTLHGRGPVTAEATSGVFSAASKADRRPPLRVQPPQTATPHTFCQAQKKNRLLRARLTPPLPLPTVAMATGKEEAPSWMKTICSGVGKHGPTAPSSADMEERPVTCFSPSFHLSVSRTFCGVQVHNGRISFDFRHIKSTRLCCTITTPCSQPLYLPSRLIRSASLQFRSFPC